jgi:hypothetical protein
VPILKQYGLVPAMMTGAGTSFQDGLIRKELHDKFEAAFQPASTRAPLRLSQSHREARERRGMAREEAADNAIAILSRVKATQSRKA